MAAATDAHPDAERIRETPDLTEES